MNINKLAPWNRFKREEAMKNATVPVKREVHADYDLLPFERVRQEMDRVLEDFFSAWRQPDSLFAPLMQSVDRWLKPSVDISSTGQEYTVNIELPGVDQNDVHVELSGDALRVCGEKKFEQENKNRDYYAVERSYGTFQRVLSLPEDADQDGISAHFKHGVMTITIPRKASAQTKGKPIEITTE